MRSLLVILDFSGTLSLGAVLFARNQRIRSALRKSGFWALGLQRPSDLWEHVVDPTWEAGSTGAMTYAECLVAGLTALLPGADPQAVRAGAERFSAEYLNASRIDEGWDALLHELSADRRVLPLIATDHYREASAHLTRELSTLGLQGACLPDEPLAPQKPGVQVASSADLGCVKTKTLFWQRVRTALEPHLPEQILVVDDFGYNETSADQYAAREKVEFRRQRTVSLVTSVFGVSVAAFPFLLPTRQQESAAGLAGEQARLIARCRAQIRAALPKEPH